MSTTAHPIVRRWSPTPDQAEYLRVTDATSRFLRNLSDDIRRQYAGQWVAAQGCEVVACAPTRSELCAKLGEPRDPTILMIRLRLLTRFELAEELDA